MTKPPTFMHPRLQRGLTLVEILITLVMGLVLLAGVITVFIANKQTYRHQDALSRLQENGRYAINRLERDIRRAAATFGCVPESPVNTLNSVVDGSSAGCPSSTLVPVSGEPIQGLNNVTNRTIGGKTVKNGTDVLEILLGIGQQCLILEDNRPSAQMKVQSTCSTLKDFDIVMVVNDLTCQRGAVFQITNTNARPEGNNHHVEVVHNTGRGFPGNCSKDIGPEFTDGYMVKIAYVSYFIADTGRGVPALYRYEAPGGQVEELVEGVEDMQLLFGVDADNDNDRMVERYWNADKIQSESAGGTNYWARVRSVRPNLLLASVDANALSAANPVVETNRYVGDGGSSADEDWYEWAVSPTDKRWRQAYSATVGVRGRLP